VTELCFNDYGRLSVCTIPELVCLLGSDIFW